MGILCIHWSCDDTSWRMILWQIKFILWKVYSFHYSLSLVMFSIVKYSEHSKWINSKELHLRCICHSSLFIIDYFDISSVSFEIYSGSISSVLVRSNLFALKFSKFENKKKSTYRRYASIASPTEKHFRLNFVLEKFESLNCSTGRLFVSNVES